MKVTKTVTVPAKTQVVFDYLKCELCENVSYKDDWEPDLYQVCEPSVVLREGYNYPGDYSVESTVLDICPDCFKKKLIPWFVSQGGSVRTED